jgi:hypothetical protein
LFATVFGSGSAWIRIDIRQLDPDPGGPKITHKNRKSGEILNFEVMDVLFCGLKASLVAWTFFMEV